MADGRHWAAPRWAPWVTLPLTVVGLALSVYLTVVHYTEPRSLACPATSTINCTKVTTSAQSMLFGHLPVALAGALYFLMMTALVAPGTWRQTSRPWIRGRVGAAVAGMAMVVWLVYAEVVVLHAVCLWCTAVHVVMFALFVATVAATSWGGAPAEGDDHDDIDTSYRRDAALPAAREADSR